LSILPRVLVQKIGFPTAAELLRNMASRMPNGMGWLEVWSGPAGFVVPDLAAITDVDPGTRAVSQRLLADYDTKE
jgi:hypothetical protein